MVKVLVINGSPRKQKGNTALVLDAFVDGMVEAGADVDQVYASELDIKPCVGEFDCWYHNVGHCYIRDDMQSLYPRLRESDVWVVGTPVFIPLPGALTNLLNRLMPLIQCIVETKDGRTRARFHTDVRTKRFVLVGVSGWWELDNFGSVIHVMTELCKDVGLEFSGAVLRPHAYYMKEKGELTEDGKEVLRAAHRAGRQLVEWGYMSPEALEAVRRPLVDLEKFVRDENEEFAAAVEAMKRPRPPAKAQRIKKMESGRPKKARGKSRRKGRGGPKR